MNRLEHAARGWRADAPPADLGERILAAARRTEAAPPLSLPEAPKRRQSWTNRHTESGAPLRENHKMQRRLFLTIAVAAGASFIFGLYSHPIVADAQIIRRMDAAVAKVRNAHVVIWTTDYTTDNGAVAHHFETLQKTEESWYQDGKTRKEGLWGSRLIVGATESVTDAQGNKTLRTPGLYYRYDPKAGKVRAVPELGLQWSRFTLDEVAGNLMSRPPSAMETLSVDTLNGRTTREISIATSRDSASMNHHPADGDRRTLCWVDVDTGLPERILDEQYAGAAWRGKSKIELEFNQNLDPALFDPSTLSR